MFELLKTEGKARRGVFTCAHGTVQTPVFMNVGTQGAIKGALSAKDLKDIGCQVELSNTYHLHLRPGDKLVKECGGLHKFMTWDGPILTDSGGFQVFSLASLRKIKEEGVTFASHIDGHKIFMGPEESMQIQSNLGSDICMAFDECIENPAPRDYVLQLVEITPHGGNVLDYAKIVRSKSMLRELQQVGTDIVEYDFAIHNFHTENDAVCVGHTDGLFPSELSCQVVESKRRRKRIVREGDKSLLGFASEFGMLSCEFCERAFKLRRLGEFVWSGTHSSGDYSSNSFISSSTVTRSARPARYSASECRHSLTKASWRMRLNSSANMTTYFGVLLLMTQTGPWARLSFMTLIPRRLTSCAGKVTGI